MEVQVGKIKIYYECSGEGKSLLFLHGWGGNWESWYPIFQHFKAGFKVIALDLPGFGKSDVPSTPLGIYDYANILAEFIRKIDIEKPLVIGHSFGGSVAIVLAARYPKLMSHLVLVDVSGIRIKSFRKTILYILAKAGKGFFLIPLISQLQKSAQKIFYRIIKEEDYLKAGKLRESFKLIVKEDIRSLLPKISVPTLILWGENDSLIPLSHAKIFHNLIRKSQLVVIPHTGHFSYLENPERFEEEVEKFINLKK